MGTDRVGSWQAGRGRGRNTEAGRARGRRYNTETGRARGRGNRGVGKVTSRGYNLRGAGGASQVGVQAELGLSSVTVC